MELTKTQQEYVKVLVDIHENSKKSVKCEEIAECIHRAHGTIRNQMQILKNLNLVKGVPGPKGGYLPTSLAYEYMNFSHEIALVPIYHNGKISKVMLKEIRLKLPNYGILHVLGDITNFKSGDRINLESKKFIFLGKVLGRDDINNYLLSAIEIAFLRE